MAERKPMSGKKLSFLGRIEADQVDISSKYGGRIVSIHATEGDLVEKRQVLAVMDTAADEALLAETMAAVAEARESIEEAKAAILQRESELKFAEQELARARALVEKGHISQQQADQKLSATTIAQAALETAKARLESVRQRAALRQAEVRRIGVRIGEATLNAPVKGRVLYRLAEPGEVLPAGGKIMSLIDFSDVSMTIFLPSEEAGRTKTGAEGRIRIDALPDFVLPGWVSFVSPEAQFTPEQVESRSERGRLMFRIKVKIPTDLVMGNLEKVKIGSRGVAYVRLNEAAEWPAHLTVNLPRDAAGR